MATCLFFAVFSKPLAAQEQSVSSDWRLGLGLFFPVPEQKLESLDADTFDLDNLATVAGEAGEGRFSATLPGLLAAHIEPLSPPVPEISGDLHNAALEAVFVVKNKDEHFFDPRSDREAIDGLRGFVAGLYVQKSSSLELLVLYYEKTSPLPRLFTRFSLSLGELDKFYEILLPRIFSWISGRDLSVYDVKSGVFGTLGIQRSAGTDAWHAHRDSRIFIEGSGSHVFSLSATGYEDRNVEIDNPGPFLFRVVEAPLAEVSGTSPAQAFVESRKALDWKEAEAFAKARGRFSASLGRFLASLPPSLVSVGNFLSFQEAYLRYAKPASAYYGSVAFAGISAALSLGFAVDTIIALVDLLRISR